MIIEFAAVVLKGDPAIITLHAAPCGSPDSENTVFTVAGVVVVTAVVAVVDETEEVDAVLVEPAVLVFASWNESRTWWLGAGAPR